VPDDSTWLTIRSAALTAQIDPLGAQLSTLRTSSGQDLLWDGNPAFWNGRAPLLFPIVGALKDGVYRLGGRRYALPRHGFARGSPFEVVRASVAQALLRLKADDQSFKVYPFHFRLEVHFEIRDSMLVVRTSVGNDGEAPMPASFGYHPAFRWPLPCGAERAQHAIDFEREEVPVIRRLDAAGLVTPTEHPSPIRGTRLQLDDELFRSDAMILAPVRSQAVSYGATAGPRIALRFPDTPFLGLWSKPGAPFICIEPWHGIADPAGFNGDFTEKPGVFMVPPGAERELKMEISVAGH
jgi:galactose mutarotase-like enzyme